MKDKLKQVDRMKDKIGSIGDMTKVLNKEHPIPVKLANRAEFWVMPSRSTIETARFIVVFRIGRKVYTNCSCPAGTRTPPVTCYHAIAVARERMRLINDKEMLRRTKLVEKATKTLKGKKRATRKR